MTSGFPLVLNLFRIPFMASRCTGTALNLHGVALRIKDKLIETDE